MRKVAIVGVGMTPFGKHLERSLIDLMLEASMKSLIDAEVAKCDLDALYVGNMAAGEFCGLGNIASVAADQLGLLPCTVDRIENSTASGASAIRNAYAAIAAGLIDSALVIGVEKMRHLSTSDVTKVVASVANPMGERVHGVTFPSLAAMLTRLYMHRYGVTREQLAKVAVKNHENGTKNPFAHIRKSITVDDVLNSPVVADPLRLYDCCPISDGAAALILCSYEKSRDFTSKNVIIKGIGQASDNQMFVERDCPLTLSAVKRAAAKALKRAEISMSDVDVVELHDAFTILEIVQSEDLGLFGKGRGGRAVEQGETEISGEMPINPSGGLKARGHPLGATGVAQAVEIVWQLRKEAGERQVKDPRIGLTCNLSGFAANAVVTLYGRE